MLTDSNGYLHVEQKPPTDFSVFDKRVVNVEDV